MDITTMSSSSSKESDKEGLSYMFAILVELEKFRTNIRNLLWLISKQEVNWSPIAAPTPITNILDFKPAGVEVMLCQVVKHLQLFKNYFNVAKDVRKHWELTRAPWGFVTNEEAKAKAAESVHNFQLATEIREKFQRETTKLFTEWEKSIHVIEAVLAFAVANDAYCHSSMSGLPYFLKELLDIIAKSQLAVLCMYERCKEVIPVQYRVNP